MVVAPPAGRPGPGLRLVARVRSDLTVAQAQLRVDAIASRLDQEKPAKAGWALGLGPLVARHVNAPVRTALYVLAGAVSLVLLIACANLANLLLVQGANRQREVAVRAALGASRGRLIRQLLTETLLLAVLGATAGTLLAHWAIGLLERFTPSDMTFLTVNPIALDARVVMFAGGLAMATVLLFGTLPAVRGSRSGPARGAQERHAKRHGDARSGASAPRVRRRAAGRVGDVARRGRPPDADVHASECRQPRLRRTGRSPLPA